MPDFTTPSYEEWYQATVESLKGAPFEKLLTQTYEGIQLQPLYHQAEIPHQNTFPGTFPYVRGTDHLAKPWLIAQQTLNPDLKNGQTVINVVVKTPDELDGMDITNVPLFIRADEASYDVVMMLQNADQLTGWIAYDPLRILAEKGTLSIRLEQAYNQMADLLKWSIMDAPNMDVIGVHTDVYHNGGANAVQELAFALATGVAYIRQMTLARSFDLDVMVSKMRFGFAIGGNFFMEVAKLRAARLLWAQIVKAFGGGEVAQKMKIHASTGMVNKTVLDPYVNMLRTTIEGLAGAVGGADSMHIAPFDVLFQQPDDFSSRIARNQQIILQNECNLTSLIDPAGGSWYVEALTDQLGKAAWELFQEIEAQGGMLKSLKDGFPQAQIEQVAAQRTENLAKRKDVLIGVNIHPNMSDELPQMPEASTPKDTPFEPVKPYRAAEPFEKLRYATAKHPASIFLANMGALRQYKTRADFAKGFYEISGCEIINPAGFETPEQAADAALESGAGAVVICSMDETYPELVPPFVKRIKASKPNMIVILAGYPQDQVEAHQAAGVDDFIHIRANCYDMNYKLLQQMGVIE